MTIQNYNEKLIIWWCGQFINTKDHENWTFNKKVLIGDIYKKVATRSLIIEGEYISYHNYFISSH